MARKRVLRKYAPPANKPYMIVTQKYAQDIAVAHGLAMEKLADTKYSRNRVIKSTPWNTGGIMTLNNEIAELQKFIRRFHKRLRTAQKALQNSTVQRAQKGEQQNG